MRWLGALLIVSASTAFGIMLSHGLSLRVRKLESALLYIDALREEMRHTAAELPQILHRLHGEVYIEDGEWCGTQGLNEEDMTVLRSFLRALGTTDMQGQLKNISSHRTLLEARLCDARGRRQNFSRLYVSLGFFCGLFVAVVLI